MFNKTNELSKGGEEEKKVLVDGRRTERKPTRVKKR
jgi:hypothetical protein